jgi:hypothetical protein
MGKEQDSLQRSGTAITDDRRLEQRMPVELIIEVSGFDCSLRYFTERTETCDASESGCQFRLHMSLAPETVVTVRATCSSGVGSNSKADLFRIVRTWQEPQSILIGAQALQPLQPHSLQSGRLYRSLLLALLLSGAGRPRS